MTRLAIYNGALAHLKLRQLSSLKDLRTSRLALDRAWDKAVRDALQAGPWKFAARTAWLQNEPRLCAEHGFAFAFRKPPKWLRTISICLDEKLTDRTDSIEGPEYIHAHVQRLHVKWVGDADFIRWPAPFVAYVEALLASRIAGELPVRGVTSSELTDLANELCEEALRTEAEALPVERRTFRAMTPRADGGGTVRLLG